MESIAWSIDDIVGHLRTSSLFESIELPTLVRFAEAASVCSIPAGATLMSEGEIGDRVYVIVAGRLDVLVRTSEGAERSVNQLGSGQVIGEMALLTDEPRSATVRARRDSVLVEIDSEDFRRIVLDHPEALLGIARTVTQRLNRSIHEVRPESGATVVAIVPAGHVSDHHEFARLFTAALSSTKAACLSAGEAYQALGQDPTTSEITQFLHQVEDQNRFVVLIGDESDPEWTQLCERQSDVVLLVGNASELGSSSRRDTSGADREMRVPSQQLVILHDDDQPQGTAEILQIHGGLRHHHVRTGSASDIARIARIVQGVSVGVVFGGGGARGFAHLGVLRAMDEAGVPIDHVGGASIGSSIAAAYAKGLGWERISELTRRVTFERGRLLDITLPSVSVAMGRRLVGGMIEGYGDVEIEDLRTDFYCVSSDLTAGSLRVHTSGSVWSAVRASIAIPGVFPPMRSEEGHVLVDGGVLDNVPTATMKGLFAPRSLVAVDLRAPHAMATSDIPEDGSISGWMVARRRWFPWRDRPAVPGIVETLVAASTVSGSTNGDDADYIIRPPVGEFGFMDFAACDAIIDTGYRHALEVFERDGVPG